MTDHSDSDSSGLSDGWALVNGLGELEDRESDSTSNSIEVLEQNSEDQVNPQDAASHSHSAECMELEHLMKEADAAAATTSTAEAGGLSEPVASEPVIAPVVSTPQHLFDLSPLSAAEEPPGASYYLRRGSTGEEEVKAWRVSTQPSPDRAPHTDQASQAEGVSHRDEAPHTDQASQAEGVSHRDEACHTDQASQAEGVSHRDEAPHTDQACQTDRASPVLSERRLSLSSLWSVSSKSCSSSSSSSTTDTSSGSDASSVGSADEHTDQEECGSSSDADAESNSDSEFVCLETETTSSSCAQLLEGSVSSSGVEAKPTGSRSSVGSVLFLPGTEDSTQLSISTSLQSLPPAASQQATQGHQHHHHQQHHHHHHQQQQQQPRALASQESPSPEEQVPHAVPSEQWVVLGEEEVVEAVSSTLQDLQNEQRSQEEGAEILPPGDGLQDQDTMAEDDNNTPSTAAAAAGVEPAEQVLNHHHRRHRHPSIPSRMQEWNIRHVFLLLGSLVMVMLAFVLGHWLGVRVGHSDQVSHRDQLRWAKENHERCMSHSHLTQQHAQAALERERQLHQERVAEMQHQHAECQKDDHHSRRKSSAATGSASAPEDLHNDHWRMDFLRHLYFSMRDEREIGMNASSYLDYLTRSLNLSAVQKYLRGYWEASMNWTKGVEGVSTLLGSGLTRLQKGVAMGASDVWKTVTSTLSYTYSTLGSALNQRNNNNNAHGKENKNYGQQKYYGTEDKKYRQKNDGDFMEDEKNDEEAYVEDEEELQEEKLDYDYDWGVHREDDDDDEEEEVSEASHAWTEGEDEYVDTNNFDNARKKYSENSDREDETYSRNGGQKKWSGIMNKFLKKAQKTFSHIGRRWQDWRKDKHSRPFWSENLAFSGVAAQVKDSVNRFSSRLKKQAQSWFGKYHTDQDDSEEVHSTVDENDDGVYTVEDNEEFDEKSESDWGVNVEENHEEVNEGNHARTEEEHEYVEEEPDRNNRHRKKWSGVMRKFLKKTQKSLSRLGHRLQKTWHKIKPTTWPLWSENSAFGRIAAQVKNKINKLSSKLQKKADRWFRKRSKETKDTEAFPKRARKGTHAGSGEKVKESDHLYDQTRHAMPVEVPNTGKNEQQSDKSGGNGNSKYPPNKYENAEMSDNLNKKAMKHGASNKASKEKESEHSNKLDRKEKNGRSNIQSKENLQLRKNKKEEGSEKLSRKSAKEERSDPQNIAKEERPGKMAKKAKEKRAESGRSSQKEQTPKNQQRSGKPHERPDETWEMKLDNGHFEQREDNGRKDWFQAGNRREQQQQQKEEGEGGTESSSRASGQKRRRVAMGRARFTLQSQFQALFGKVGSMDTEAFRDWSRRDLSKMAEEVLTMAERYSDHLNLGLPVSGSLWLGCQHAFWVAAASHGVRYKPAHNCWQFLAPWQLHMLEEEEGGAAEESFTVEGPQEDAEETSGENWNSKTDTDHGVMEEDEEYFADDCRVHADISDDVGDADVSIDDGDIFDDCRVHSDINDVEDADVSIDDGDIFDDCRVHSDINDDVEDADVSIDDGDIFDDCRVHSEMNDDDMEDADVNDDDTEDTNYDSSNDTSPGDDDDDDDEYRSDEGYAYDDGSADNLMEHHPLPKGQREGDQGTTSAPNHAGQSAADSQQQPSRQTSQPWYTHRAQGRSGQRSQDHKADWMFERAKERDEARHQEHAADWVFERAAERDTSRNQKGEGGEGRRTQKAERHGRKQKAESRERKQKAESRYKGR